MLDRRNLLGVGIALSSLALLPGRARAAAPVARCGMIEIGSMGVKVCAYGFRREIVHDGEKAIKAGRLVAYRIGQGYTVNTNAVTGNIDATVRAVQDAFRRLSGSAFGVHRHNIAIVASSGIAAFPNILEPLRARVRAAIGVTMDSIDPAMEAKMSYDWIAHSQHNHEMLLIDIGSGNTKGGYYDQGGTKQQRFRDFSVPLGTTTLANLLQETSPHDAIGEATTRRIFEDRYLPDLNRQIDSTPGIMSRPRIYLLGGIAWATAILTRPAAMAGPSRFVSLTADDFEAMHGLLQHGDLDRLVRTAALSRDQRAQLHEQRVQLATTFTAEQLYAGNALCLILSDRLDLKGRSSILFPKLTVDAWSSQYLLYKFRRDQVINRVVLS